MTREGCLALTSMWYPTEDGRPASFSSSRRLNTNEREIICLHYYHVIAGVWRTRINSRKLTFLRSQSGWGRIPAWYSAFRDPPQSPIDIAMEITSNHNKLLHNHFWVRNQISLKLFFDKSRVKWNNSVHWLIGWSLNWLVSWLIDWLIAQLVG